MKVKLISFLTISCFIVATSCNYSKDEDFNSSKTIPAPSASNSNPTNSIYTVYEAQTIGVEKDNAKIARQIQIIDVVVENFAW
jgi:hypothetical protein